MSDNPPAPPSPATPAPDSLSATLGLVRVVSLDPAGRAVIEYLAGAHMCHSGGVVQGGFVTGWIDAAMAHAAIAMAGDAVVPMSLELKVSFFAPARPGVVTAEAWVEKRGRSTCFFEGRLCDADGKVLAKASSTLMLADKARVEGAAKAAVSS
jgi:acyl-CoA thioesterase